MMKRRFATNASAVALGLILAGCGGGGGGGPISTPPPAPAPTPVPAPTPTPTPTPTATNDDLLTPLVSESFQNVASFGALTVPTSGANVTVDSGPLTLNISYDAANQSYTVSDGTRSRVFGPGNLDSAQSSAALTTYRVTVGNTTDTLSLTKTGTAAGQTRYVAAGFWQRQVNGATAVEGRFEAFAYGIKTPDGSLPRSGVASFDVTLLGAQTFETLVYAMAGQGVLDVDLQTGAIVARGTFSRTDVVNGSPTQSGFGWGFEAFLAANSNNFSGAITIDSGSVGEVHGAFFGPAAEEVGATFSADNNSNVVASGAIFGARADHNLNEVTNLANPENNVFFRPLAVAARGTLNGANQLSDIATAAEIVAVYRGSPFTSQAEFFSADGRIVGAFLPANQDVAFTFNATTHLGAGLLIDRRTSLGQLDAFVYGFETAAAAVPRTGSASFDVALQGGVLAPGANFQSLSGQGALSVDFAAATVSTLGTYGVSSVLPVFTFQPPGTDTDSGSWTGSGTLSASANSFTGSFAMDGTTDYSGNLLGRFFGPGAEEVGAVVQASAGSGARVVGYLTGARGVGAGASQTGLLDLTTTTTLPGSDAQFNTRPSVSPAQSTILNNGIEITYDPIAKSYVFVSPGPGGPGPVPLNHMLSEANHNAAGSDAAFTAYQATGFTARLFNPGAANPRIALTYTSFAEIIEDVIHDGRATNSQHYIAFGGQTPNFQVPTTGSASYTGVVYGSGRYGRLANEAALSGSSKFNVNFAASSATMLLDLTATDKLSGTAFALGNISFVGSLGGFCPGGCNRNTFGLNIDPVALPGGSGVVNGQFNGPNAAEFGATFQFDLPASVPGQADSSSTFAGVTVGKKD